MRFPWSKSKKAVKAAEQERDSSGKFAPPQVQTTVKAVEAEAKNVSALVETLKGVQELNDMMGGGIEEEAVGLGSEWIPLIQTGLQMFGPAITPYLPSILERFGFTAAPSPPLPPASPSPTAQQPMQAAQEDALVWFKRAANTSPKLIKPALPAVYSEVEKRGMSKKEFKQGITNIYKAMGGE
jgi:hypothetical protein